MTTVAAAVVVLGVLIFIHELGHFLVAKRLGVTVLRFSLGFGPVIARKQRGETEYCLSAIPLGGYVKMLGEGMDEYESLSEEERRNSFTDQKLWKRAAIVIAGPLSNFLLAILLFAVVIKFIGVMDPTARIGQVKPDSPAEKAGILVDDVVREINGKPVESWIDLSTIIKSEEHYPLEIYLLRGEEILRVEVTPELTDIEDYSGKTIKLPLIGVQPGEVPATLQQSLYYAVIKSYNLSKLMLKTPLMLLQGEVSPRQLGGPIAIAQMAGEQAREGLLNLVHFTGFISINLAILNILPIPVLDGGLLLFFLIEAFLGRPLGTKQMEYAQRFGLMILMTLIVLVFYNDIMRIFTGAEWGSP